MLAQSKEYTACPVTAVLPVKVHVEISPTESNCDRQIETFNVPMRVALTYSK